MQGKRNRFSGSETFVITALEKIWRRLESYVNIRQGRLIWRFVTCRS